MVEFVKIDGTKIDYVTDELNELIAAAYEETDGREGRLQDALDAFQLPEPKPDVPAAALMNGIYCWSWGGEEGENLQLGLWGPRSVIHVANDLSGKGNHLLADLPDWAPAYSRPAAGEAAKLGVHRFPDGHDHFGTVYKFAQPMEIAKGQGFYMACVTENTRGHGHREYWGLGADRFVMDQSRGIMSYSFGGDRQLHRLGDGVPINRAVLIEVWRVGQDMAFAVDGKVTGLVKDDREFTMGGFGFDDTGNSYFDDELLELCYCNAAPDVEQILAYRQEVAERWDQYGYYLDV